jgi:hypothetical protein
MIEAHGATRKPDGGLLSDCGGMLAALTGEQRDAVAHFPLLLVDMRFQDAAWWTDVGRRPAQPLIVPSWLAPMPGESAVRLARTSLVLAWHTARVDMDAASVVLGMNDDTGAILAGLSLLDIDSIAVHHYGHLRPRWEDRPSLWRHLLVAAQSSPAALNSDITLRALQCAPGAHKATT